MLIPTMLHVLIPTMLHVLIPTMLHVLIPTMLHVLITTVLIWAIKMVEGLQTYGGTFLFPDTVARQQATCITRQPDLHVIKVFPRLPSVSLFDPCTLPRHCTSHQAFLPPGIGGVVTTHCHGNMLGSPAS